MAKIKKITVQPNPLPIVDCVWFEDIEDPDYKMWVCECPNCQSSIDVPDSFVRQPDQSWKMEYYCEKCELEIIARHY